MIPYEDLVAALSAWRARNGLPVGAADYLGEPQDQSMDYALPVTEQYADAAPEAIEFADSASYEELGDDDFTGAGAESDDGGIAYDAADGYEGESYDSQRYDTAEGEAGFDEGYQAEGGYDEGQGYEAAADPGTEAVQDIDAAFDAVGGDAYAESDGHVDEASVMSEEIDTGDYGEQTMAADEGYEAAAYADDSEDIAVDVGEEVEEVPMDLSSMDGEETVLGENPRAAALDEDATRVGEDVEFAGMEAEQTDLGIGPDQLEGDDAPDDDPQA